MLQVKSFCFECVFLYLTKLPCLLNVFPQMAQDKLFFVLCSLDVEAFSPSEDEPALSSEMNKIPIKYHL